MNEDAARSIGLEEVIGIGHRFELQVGSCGVLEEHGVLLTC